MSLLPALPPLVLLAGAVIGLLIGLWRTHAAQVVAVLTSAITLVVALAGLVEVAGGGRLVHEFGGWPPPIGIEYVLDPLSGYMAAIIGLIGLLVAIFPSRAGFGFVVRRGLPVYTLVQLLLAGLLGVVMSGDLFHLFVFLEIYAIATYALVATGGDRAVFASFRYLLLGTIGSSFYLLGVGFLYFSTGTLNMVDMAAQLPGVIDNPAVLGSMGLIVVGLGLKMAIFPLHVWLPDAHTYAPPAVGALLAAVQVKAAAYALIRVLFDVYGPAFTGSSLPVSTALTWFGAAGIVFGSVLAIRQTDLKRLLAYSTVAQLGYIGLGIGLATPLALIGALLHVLNHALMKGGLFLVAGAIIDRTGLTTIARFTGLGRRMPIVMTGFAIAALSMGGIPPTAGFFSKFYLAWATIDRGQWVLTGVVVASSLLTVAYFLRLIEQLFVQAPREQVVSQATEPHARIWGTVTVTAVGLLAVGLGNVVLVRHVLAPLAERMLG